MEMSMMLNALLMAMKPQSFLISVMSVSVGTVLAALSHPIHWGDYLLTVLGVVFLHGGTNVVNDYFDYKNKVDTTEVPGSYGNERRVLIQKLLSPSQVLLTGFILFGLSLMIGIYLTFAKGITVFVIGALGFLVGFFYSANPISFKYFALGEPAVFLMWGPLMVSGAYYVQTGGFSLQTFLVSFPLGILVALVLLANNIRDIQYDGQVGIRTLATELGKDRAIKLYRFLIAAVYLWTALMVVTKQLSPWSLSVLFSIPLAYKLAQGLQRRIPKDADARTAQLNTAFGAFLIVGLILGRFL
jgi:1,4-dihydroxy-2-naphthoate octaprenyltransferase